jgi:hypothetical protein
VDPTAATWTASNRDTCATPPPCVSEGGIDAPLREQKLGMVGCDPAGMTRPETAAITIREHEEHGAREHQARLTTPPGYQECRVYDKPDHRHDQHPCPCDGAVGILKLSRKTRDVVVALRKPAPVNHIARPTIARTANTMLASPPQRRNPSCCIALPIFLESIRNPSGANL